MWMRDFVISFRQCNLPDGQERLARAIHLVLARKQSDAEEVQEPEEVQQGMTEQWETATVEESVLA